MDDFSRISTVLSILLGLGMARLLLGLVTVFRTRSVSPVDWLPLTWAAIIFVMMLQYWWAINGLRAIKDRYDFIDFFHLTVLPLMLFLSAALLLPSRPEDETGGLRQYFERDGRFGLLAFAAFLILAFTVNVLLYRAPTMSLWALLDIPMIAIPCAVFATKARRVQAWLSIAYIPLSAADLLVSLAEA